MGYNGVVMEIVLTKLMVIKCGGSLQLEQDPDENDRCIAKLVNQFRYTLGKNKGMTAFKPHYALYTAGAFRTVEEMTSEFSLMLVYSLCLPPELPFIRGNNGFDLLRMELAVSITKLHDDLGLMAQLRLYVARLQYGMLGSFGIWDQKKAVESATWYTIRGEPLGDSISTPVNWTTDLHFLNPGNETLSQLWSNREGEFVYRYERFAVVGWPKVVDIKNTHVFMGEMAAANSVFMDAPVQLARLRMLLRYQANQYNQTDFGNQATNRSVQTAIKTPVSLAACQNLYKAISESNEVLLVDVFFRKYFARLGQKRELVPFLASIVRKFGWEGVSAPIVRAFDSMSSSGCLALALLLADALIDVSSVRTAPTITAVQKAGFAFGTSPGELMASSDVFRDVGNIFAWLEAKMIGPAVEALSKCVGASSLPEHRAVLATMASQRRQWLMDQDAQTEKPFAWEIVDMNFVGAAGMATFLDGPNTSYQVRCFQDDRRWPRARCVCSCHQASRQVYPEKPRPAQI
ncbi:hypothetical protein PHYSODRAFT_472928 [Phytophthora sojae]|uniref:Uncharacterized protein n=1 Tax=Phytophthora sojae (strain P6497) TaxID=1094619 RepID=G4YFZ4_PHYSP|nr:hypothetical protein PHYSODRAFT_472928 [Phytophthora sojae]EGZ28042.1 hypothetical protein PHYSODRAFT_472928 [Phytophthora sojae]|eukprot:XP_009515317.1 hypothetical protein PHYSODRAFT_472928 [Phytophthora sojae]